MIMNDEEIKERLNSEKNLCQVIEKKRWKGRVEGSKNVPESVRELISKIKNTSDDTGEEIAEVFGVNESSVSRFSRGLVGGERVDAKLMETVRTAKLEKRDREDEAHEAALDVLMTSLSSLQPKLLDPELKARDISTIAKNMSAVAKDMKGGRDDGGVTNNTQVILFAPGRKKLSNYDFIEG
jgi:hypothetical protein